MALDIAWHCTPRKAARQNRGLPRTPRLGAGDGRGSSAGGTALATRPRQRLGLAPRHGADRARGAGQVGGPLHDALWFLYRAAILFLPRRDTQE
jgi:hypothetical protein